MEVAARDDLRGGTTGPALHAAHPSALRILGLRCHALTRSQSREYAVQCIAEREPHHVLFINAAKVVGARTDPNLSAALERASLVGADGMPIVWVSRLLGSPLPGRVNGTNMMMDVLELAAERGWRVFFLGATDDVLAEAIAAGKRRFPQLVVAGQRNGYFDGSENPAVVAQIASSRADVLLVGMPSPRKEQWLDEHGADTGVPLSIAVGGSLDVLAGRVRRAPASWQAGGLEWLWRLLQEPRRMWRRYLRTNSRFLAIVARECAASLRRRR